MRKVPGELAPSSWRYLGWLGLLTLTSIFVRLVFFSNEMNDFGYNFEPQNASSNLQSKLSFKGGGFFRQVFSKFSKSEAGRGSRPPLPAADSSPSSLLLSYPTYRKKNFDAMTGVFQQSRVNCSALFAGNNTEIKKAHAVAKVIAAEEEKTNAGKVWKMGMRAANDKLARAMKVKVKEWAGEFGRLSNQWYVNATKNCEKFRQTRGYILSPLTEEEAAFPIAFSILVFKDIELVERLLRMIYRPQNRYCIHVDSKADPEFFAAVKGVASCFNESVVMATRRVDVKWGKFTVLEPELICMKDLWGAGGEGIKLDQTKRAAGDSMLSRTAENEKQPKWKYFINLTGQEFALKTNYEIVQILKAFKGANNQRGTIKRANRVRWNRTTPEPHGIIPLKGGVHTLLNRATVDFILHDHRAQDFIKWLKTTKVPDETLFASINYNPQLNIPGTYNGTDLEHVTSFARHKMWRGLKDYSCFSRQTVRGICILSTGDLPRLGKSRHLFANKFYLHQDRVVLGCLEEKLFNDTRDEFLGRKSFDTTFYAEQDFVRNRVRG